MNLVNFCTLGVNMGKFANHAESSIQFQCGGRRKSVDLLYTLYWTGTWLQSNLSLFLGKVIFSHAKILKNFSNQFPLLVLRFI